MTDDAATTMKKQITTGNGLSILTTLISAATVVVTVTLAYGKIDTRQTSAEMRLDRLERAALRAESDHDILVELRTDMKQLKAAVERLEGRRTGPAPYP